MLDESSKIRIERLVKIFGKGARKEPLELLRAGVSKDEILRRTGRVVGVSDVSFSVRQGEIFVVMGLSGSGKSTLIRCINRLITPTSGHVYLDGEDVLAADDERLREVRRAKLGMVFQHFALFSHKTVLDNVAFGLKAKGVDRGKREERAQATLRVVGLEEWGDRYPASLSGGMQQRVGLARALATDPDVLLMDEPFSALDPLIRRQMQDDLLELQDSILKTVVFVTHDLDEAVKMGNRIAIMQSGRIVQIGTPEEIVTSPADDYVREFVQDVNRGNVLRVGSVMDASEPLVLGQDTLETAISRLSSLGSETVYVVNGQNKPVGFVTSADLAKAEGRGAQELSQLLRANFPKVRRSASLNQALPLLSETHPAAVVDSHGTFVGVIGPASLMKGLG